MNRKILRRILLVGTLALLATPGVLANMSSNDLLTTSNSHAFGDEITVSTGVLVVRTSDTNDAVKLGLGTTVPDARLHVKDQAVANGASAVQVDYGNTGSSITSYGLKVTATGFNDKGAEIGVNADAAKTGGPDPQRGSTMGRLAYATGFHSQGHFQGVTGSSTPGALRNFDATFTSTAVGGSFIANPSGLALDGTGTYWVGGVIGQAQGYVNGSAGQGAVAGVIGIAANSGTAKTFAGYFKGDVKTTGDSAAESVTLAATSLGTCTPGTMKYVAGSIGVPDTFHMCLRNVLGVPLWVQVASG